MAKLPKRDRLHQAMRWLRHEFPARHSIRLRVCQAMPKGDGDCDGTATFGGANGPIIRLNDARSRSTLIYALLHEYSHVLLVDRHPRDWGAIEHTDAFYRQLGVLERRWFDGGEVESTDF